MFLTFISFLYAHWPPLSLFPSFCLPCPLLLACFIFISLSISFSYHKPMTWDTKPEDQDDKFSPNLA